MKLSPPCMPRSVTFVVLFILVGATSSLVAQKKTVEYDFPKFEAGFTANFLAADQGATLSMFSSRNDTTFVTGSSFIGAQSGFSARVNFELGEKKKFIVPFGFDYTFFRGIQRLENPGLIGHGSVSVNMFTPVVGLQYRVIELPLAKAFIYGGIEARGSFIGGPRFQYEVETADSVVKGLSRDTVLKDNVFRLGGAIRIGCQGELSEPLRINVNLAYGVNNLVGRDLRSNATDRRGQLLTPTSIGETNEAFSKFIQLGIWLQYHF